MRIDLRIDCTANEFRRLGGQPDLLPLAELVGVAMERWLQARILAVELAASPPREGSDDQPADRRSESHGGRRSDRG